MKPFEQNIVITGFMGTGKSVAAKILSKKLKRPIVDTDNVIAERFGKTISEIFETDGEAAFRQAESELCVELAQKEGLIIATGGGTLVSLPNFEVLQKNNTLVCLTASLETVLSRISHRTHRPLFKKVNMQMLLADRQSAYGRIFHQIKTDNLSSNEVTRKIEEIYQLDQKFQNTSLLVKVPCAKSYPVVIKENLLSQIPELFNWAGLNFEKTVIVTNDKVSKLYAKQIKNLQKELHSEVVVIEIPDGEIHKTLATVQKVYQQLLEHKISRDDGIVAFGGGVTGDIAGFVAATYLRGIALVQIPTTLLAMVDSSVGGKTAVDMSEGKNLIGAFKQPDAVFIDPEVLKTLEPAEILSGLGEIVKHAMIDNESLFALLENMKPDSLAWTELIKQAILTKIKLVEEDPFENNKRAHLNLGHTFAHALELVSEFKLKHGEAVAIGLLAACQLANLLGTAKEDLTGRVSKLLQKLKIPTQFSGSSAEVIYEAMAHDKKRTSNALRFILPISLGKIDIYAVKQRDLILNAIKYILQ